jgi:transcriptional regulator with XRE-family HTH domain
MIIISRRVSMTIVLSFAKVLKSMRIMKKMSQEELAFRSELDRTYISMLERGVHQPTITTLFALSRALNIKPSEMINLVEIDYDEVDT